MNRKCLKARRCVTGGLGSPRQYAGGRGDHGPHPGYPQPPSHVSQYPPPPHPPPPNPLQQQMMYQDSQYCYDQTGLQLAYNGQPDRGRGPPPHPHIAGGKCEPNHTRHALYAPPNTLNTSSTSFISHSK